MNRPATATSPARRAQALEEVALDVEQWQRVAVDAVSAAEGAQADAEWRLDGVAATVIEAVSTAEMTGESVAGAVGEMDRLGREADEAGASVDIRGECVEQASRYVTQTVARWRDCGGRPFQLAELGNVDAGQASGRLAGCLQRCRALAERVRSAVAVEDALVANAAQHEALVRARQAQARGASHLHALVVSSRVDAARDEAGRRSERAVTRLTAQAEALHRYDQPAGGAS
ncbi:MAG: hypothetical protein ACR2MN_04730 [Acidimicrobiales bacterium]